MNQYLAYEVIIDNNENTSWYLRLKKKKEKKNRTKLEQGLFVESIDRLIPRCSRGPSWA